jgi:hypothetical protein
MAAQPALIPEKGAKRAGYLPMLIAFIAGWKIVGNAQRGAPEFEKLLGVVSVWDGKALDR